MCTVGIELGSARERDNHVPMEKYRVGFSGTCNVGAEMGSRCPGNGIEACSRRAPQQHENALHSAERYVGEVDMLRDSGIQCRQTRKMVHTPPPFTNAIHEITDQSTRPAQHSK